MNAKEEIKKLQQQLDNLKAELDKPKFEVGDWVVSNLGEIGRIKNDGLELFPNTSNTAYCLGDMSDIKRLATRTEIETELRKEAERRGFKKGVYVDNTELGWDVDGYKINGAYWRYDELNDRLSLDSYFIYDNGKWAEIVEDKVKFFDWDVVYGGSLIGIGCEDYSKNFLLELESALSHLSDKTVLEVLTELEKLDLD